MSISLRYVISALQLTILHLSTAELFTAVLGFDSFYLIDGDLLFQHINIFHLTK